MGDPIKQPNIGDYIDGLGKIPRASVALGKPTNINIDDYKGYLKNGVNSDFDYNLKRAQNQSGWEQAGLFLANVIPNIAGSVIENVGYLGALVTEWGDDRNYSNVLTKLGNDVKNPFGQIFREHPQSTWDLSDPAWWYGNAEGLVESATAFAGVGWGLGKVFSTISELARFGSTAKNIIQGTNALAHLSTAGALAYAEAAQFGGTTYETTYNEQLKKAIDNGVEYSQAKEQAKHIASQGAAAAVQLNTIFATALNLTAIAPLFRTEEGLAMSLKKKFAREASESYGQWETRLRSIAANDPGIAKLLDTRERLLHTLAGEGAQEGVEELINQWAEQRGLDRGKKGKELNGLEDLLGDLEYFFDDTMNSQGALSFVLGAVGGIAQTAGIQAIPYHKVYTDAEGNQSLRKFDTALNDKGGYTTKFVSSRNREKVGNRAFFENTKKAVLNDFKRISDIKTELEKALKNNDTVEAERLKFQLFDSAAINSIQLGLGDSFSSQFDEIANLDNETPLSEALTPQINQLTEAIGQAQTQEEKDSLTIQREKLVKQAEALAGVTEAMQRGFAKDTKDNEYKAQAREAESDSKEYARLWDDIQKKHSSEDEYHSRYADYLFAKTVDVRRKEKILNKFEQILNKEQAASEEFQNSDLAEKSITEARVDNEVRNRLTEDYKAIKEAADKNDEARLEELLKKYLPNVDSSSDLATEAPKIVRSIINKIKAIDKRFNDNVESLSQTEGYLAWKEKNPDKEVIDYLLASQKQSAAIKSLTQDRIELNTSRAQLQTNKEQLENLQTAKGKKDYIAKAKESTNRLAKTIKAKIDKDNKAYIDNLFSDKSAQELDTVQKAEYVKSLQSELESLNQELANLQIEKNTSLDDRSWLLKKGLIGRRLVSDTLQKNAEHITNLNKQIQETQAKITTTEAKLKVLVENPETEIEDLEGTEEPGVTIKPLVKSNDTTVLVSTIDQYVATPLQSASILTDLEDYETALDNGTPFSLNHLADLGYVRNGVLTAGQAAAIMQVFKEQYEDLQTEEKETEDDKEAVDELQEKINIINQKRANDLATLKKGSKGVVAKRKEINDAADAEIREITQPELFAENTTTENTSTSTPELTSDDVASEDEPYSEPNEQLSVLATSLELTVNDGLKTIDAAAKINTLTHTYLEYVVDGVFTKVEGGLNPNVNPLYLKPGYLKGGDSIQLVVDEDWNGTVNDTDNFSSGKPAQKVDKFANYKNPDGTLDMNKVGTIPIKIVDTRSGTILGYLPTTEWIGAKYETGDYRNVVDEKYDSKGELVFSNNVQEQQNLNTALRTKLTVAYNTGKKEGLIGQISSRSEGVVTETTPGLASELLPDPNLKMAILNSGAAYTEKGVAVENLAALSESYKNVPGVLLPAANGNLVFSPLLTKTLEKGQIDTVLRAIEIYLTIDGDTRVSPNVEDAAKKAAKQLFDATGFDITTSEGLEAFINQNYYYTRGFNDAEIKANQKVLKGKPKSPKFLLSISKSAGEGYNKSYIKAGVTFLNKLAKAEIDENGLLNQDFKDLLYDKSIGLSSRFRNVVYSRPELGIKGINSPGAFNEVIFQPKSGSFKVIPHESYNDMIKASSFTQVNGKNQLSSGEYVYMAHPNTQLDYKGLIDQSIQSTKQAQPSLADLSSPVESTTGAEELTEAQKEFIKTLDTDLTNSLQSLHVAVQSAGTVPGTPISLENLQELLTFTPIENRNGKTPLEVMEEVTKLGLASLPKDWNPFYQCK